MKKVYLSLIFLSLLVVFTACGTNNIETEESTSPVKENNVWSAQQTTDEFGDITDDSVSTISASFIGTFSNTATAESDLTVNVSFIQKSADGHYAAYFSLLEYNDHAATYLDSDSILLKVKIDGNTSEYTLSGIAPNGELSLGEDNLDYGADIIYNALYQGREVRCIIAIGSSSYNFALQSENFASVCQNLGYKEAAGEMTVRDCIEMYLTDTVGEWRIPYDCMNEKKDIIETITPEEYMESVGQYYLEIYIGMLIPDKNRFYPEWYVIESAEDGLRRVMYYGYDTDTHHRSYDERQPKEAVLRSSNDGLLRESFNDINSDYACYKISDNIYMQCLKTEDGDFRVSRIVIPCPDPYTFADVVENVYHSDIASITF